MSADDMTPTSIDPPPCQHLVTALRGGQTKGWTTEDHHKDDDMTGMTPRLLLILPLLVLLPACREYAVEDMLAAHDDFLHDQYVALADEYERQGMPRPTRKWFDESASWRWEAGTERRECLIEAGESKRYRGHRFWGCTQELYESEEPNSPRDRLPERVAALQFMDLTEPELDRCGRHETDPEGFLNWRSCLYLDLEK
jgi:hypothetical protein